MNKSEEEFGERVDDHIRGIMQYVITASVPLSRQDRVAAAILFLLVRVANSWRSIRTLRTHTSDPDGFAIDAGAILRAMFDAYLQAEYIVSDPAQANSRASAYFDYEHVERYKHFHKWMEHSNAMTERLKISTHRPAGEKNLLDQFDRVKDQFLVVKRQKDGTIKRGPSTRNQWYLGDLRTIAGRLGKQDEYDLLLAGLHGCVHSSAYALTGGPPVNAKHVLFWASTIAARVINLSVNRNDIQLNELNAKIVAKLNTPYFGGPVTSNEDTSES